VARFRLEFYRKTREDRRDFVTLAKKGFYND